MRKLFVIAALLLGLATFPARAAEMSASSCAHIVEDLRSKNALITELAFHSYNSATGLVGYASTSGGKIYYTHHGSRIVTADHITAAMYGFVWLVATPVPGNTGKWVRSIYASTPAGHCGIIAPNDNFLLAGPESLPARTKFAEVPPLGKTACSDIGMAVLKIGGFIETVTPVELDPVNRIVTYSGANLAVRQKIIYSTKETFISTVGHAIRGSWFLVSPAPSPLKGNSGFNPSTVENTTFPFALVGVSEDGRSCTPIYSGKLIPEALTDQARQHLNRF